MEDERERFNFKNTQCERDNENKKQYNNNKEMLTINLNNCDSICLSHNFWFNCFQVVRTLLRGENWSDLTFLLNRCAIFDNWCIIVPGLHHSWLDCFSFFMVIVSSKFVIRFNEITNIFYNNRTLIYFWLTEDRAREQRPFWNINEIRVALTKKGPSR